ncbi:hypothetical protein BGZ70_001023 [Mortierella alpina]|uniref:Uncharacterized protein n=1 Tax=Mortierella alpina TaxID=64518 RepID=A0A9P6JBV0_MORAP|nr:hypothetical protein BGZ70_001023 [Mortierella alpina]
MAPNCNTSLTLRNFQMAALDDSVLDEMTGRPAKVLVCKEHVPMPKTSFGTDTLAFKHMTSTPKPSMPGLHRSLMGERGSATNTLSSSTMTMDQKHVGSPRSLAQGSHAEFLNNLKHAESKADGEEERDQDKDASGTENKSQKQAEQQQKQQQQQEDAKEKGKETEKEKATSSSSSSSSATTTLPKYQRGRFTISDSDSITVAHAAAEDAQDPTKDDDSFRNLPVRHEDYGHKEGHTAEDSDEAKNAQDAEDWDQAEEKDEEEDHKQQRVFTMKGSSGKSSVNKSNGGSSFMNKLQQSLDQQQQQPHQQHGKGGKGGEIEVALETPVDISDRVQRDHLKIDLENDQEIEAAEIKAPPGEAEEKKLVDMAFSSKLMQEQQRNKKKNSKKRNSLTVADKAVEDDEWGTDVTSATDSLGRREPVAGM